MALGHEELAEVVTAWPLLSADLRQAILAIARSADAIAEASLSTSEAVDTLRRHWSRLRGRSEARQRPTLWLQEFRLVSMNHNSR